MIKEMTIAGEELMRHGRYREAEDRFQRVLERFSWKAIAEETLRFYASLVDPV